MGILGVGVGVVSKCSVQFAEAWVSGEGEEGKRDY